jgi:hypothetical protein
MPSDERCTVAYLSPEGKKIWMIKQRDTGNIVFTLISAVSYERIDKEAMVVA